MFEVHQGAILWDSIRMGVQSGSHKLHMITDVPPFNDRRIFNMF